MAEIGPVLPPGFKGSSSTTTDSDEEKDNGSSRSHEDPSSSIGPVLPPGFQGNKNADSSEDSSSDSASENEAAEPPKTNIGPVLPPGFKLGGSRSEPEPLDSDAHGPALPPGFRVEDSDEEDWAIGPVPHSGPHQGGSAAEALERRAQKMKDHLLNKDKEVPQERESWMTELPPEMGANIGLGPRKFKSGAGGSSCGDRSVWTDTPADREKRAQDAAEGKGDRKRKKDDTKHIVSERDRHLAEQVEEYNKSKRAKSLLELHESKLKKKKKKEKKKTKKKKDKGKSDKPERREFDRDADLQVNRFDDAMRKSVIKKSQQLGGRFAHGSQQFM